ncbi:pyridoxamine 5'-phosphate oxidase family protein [Microbacterium sp. NPDC019599]|uniref:pyridoxamine 5'-phosphate oxidase family protein n=1 Tax=Microbacterium sp. NPDC019599 TaxID=3154690 RepID=UPI0033DB0537
MLSQPGEPDGYRIALDLVAANSYLTLATSSADGEPWASPVWFAARDLEWFVWASKPGARHSRNIVHNPRVSMVIFDSSRPPGSVGALYVAADAEPVDDHGFTDALSVYNRRSIERGLGEWSPARLREPAEHRLYRAVAREIFVLDEHDERIRLA